MRGLEPVIELLAQAGRDLGMDFLGDDGAVIALIDREDQAQLLQIGFHRRLHVGILQLAGQMLALMRRGAMHLAQARRRGGLMLEAGEALLPVGPEFARHAPLDEGPAHGRRIGLKLRQLGDIFLGQRVGNGGHDLGHLHQRPLQPAERRGQLGGVTVAVDLHAQIALTRQPRGKPAHGGAHPRIAADPPGEIVVFAQSCSSSSIRPSIIVRPRSQNLGSAASRPKGASSSLCRNVPPAASIARYFSAKPWGAA